MNYRVRIGRTAQDESEQLLDFLAPTNNPFLRELIIPFGSAGYVALFEIEDQHTVTVLAVRHQREDDYH